MILHGEHTLQARQALAGELDHFRQQNISIHRYEAKELTPAKLETIFGADSLFATDKVVVIEHLHSLPRSKQKTQLIQQVAIAGLSSKNPVILFEKRALTKTMLKQFPDAEIREFKLTKYLFKWLETIQPGLHEHPTQAKKSLTMFHKALDQDGAFMCLAMLGRQLRQLIEVVETGSAKGAPFVVKKLKAQAQHFSLAELLALHTNLVQLDYAHKTGRKNNLEQDLDLWLLSL